MNVNFARLNHILIPTTKEGRDRFRASLFGKLLRPAAALYSALSDEGRVLAVAAVVVGAFGLDVQSTVVYLLWSALAGVILASLASTPFFGPEGMTAEVDAPRRVTLGEPISFSIVLANRGPRARARDAVRVHGPFLPWDGTWIGRPPRAVALEEGEERRVELTATFSARGEHHLDAFYATCLVPLGLAQGSAAMSAGVRFLVVPRVARVVRLDLPTRGRATEGSLARPSRTGDSMNLLGVRPYRLGDPVRRIHARTSARRGEPLVREYEEEQLRHVAVVLDVLDVAAPDDRTFEALLSLVAGVVSHLGAGRANVDALLVGDQLHELGTRGSPGALERTLDVLARTERGASRSSGAPERALARLRDRAPRLSGVVLVTSRIDLSLVDALQRPFGACATLLVDARGEARSGGRGVFHVPVAAIERGEPLAFS